VKLIISKEKKRLRDVGVGQVSVVQPNNHSFCGSVDFSHHLHLRVHFLHVVLVDAYGINPEPSCT